jgi:glutamine---fructose-6-phosphate transaminase (isomerizing)
MIGLRRTLSVITKRNACKYVTLGVLNEKIGHDGSSSTRHILLSAIGLASLFGLSVTQKPTENCGIIGIVGDDHVKDHLLDGLTILQNRGYDSAGIATISNSELYVTKHASKESTADSIHLVRKESGKHSGHTTGLAHTRWATHGGKTDENAHPHTDSRGRIALVHNGTINNSADLRNQLKKDGIVFKSETDTEVIAQLVGLYLDEGLSTKESLSRALARCDGSWGIAVINKNRPGEIVAACNGSPMVIGLGLGGKKFIASETTAFSTHTKNFISMNDGEITTVTPNDSPDISRIQQAPDSEVLLTPYPHAHFTIKECLEQPEAIARALSYGARLNGNNVILGGLDKNKDRLKHVKSLIITGCGTSKYAGEFGAKIMRDLDCFDNVYCIDSAEVRQSDLPKRDGALLAISQSGETKDVHRAVKVGDQSGLVCISIINQVGSLIARTTGLGVYLNAGREQAVASTKAFTSQVTVLSLLALWFRQTKEETENLSLLPKRQELLKALQRLPISFGMALRTRAQCKEIAAKLVGKKDLFVLGKGYGEPIAMEGALKIKEVSYIHAEGFSAGALKHGPLALIQDNKGPDGATPVLIVLIDDEHAKHVRIAAEEVKARGAEVHIITDNPKLAQGIDQSPIIIPENGMLTALIAALPLQLIAYELAVLKGINPDVPRNLAKAVTTD